QNVVIAFYPAAFTGGCEREMREFQVHLDEFKALDTVVLGVSVDRTPVQKAFAEHCGLPFQMVSGYPDHQGGKALGAYDEERASMRRITYIVDKQGMLRHIIDDPREMERHARESLETIRSF